MGFFANLFRGSQKQEKDNNDEYVEYLLQELEKAKTENTQALEIQRNLQKKLEEERNKKKEQEDQEKVDLQNQVKELQEKLEMKTDDDQREIIQLKERLHEYESTYQEISKYISQAKEDADAIRVSAKSQSEELIDSAKSESDRLLTSAKMQSAELLEAAQNQSEKLEAEAKAKADLYQKKIEKDLKEKIRVREEKFTIAKYQLKEYLDAFNRIQSTLVKNYNELGQWIEKMPIRLEDLFSDEPMKLLRDRGEEEAEKEDKQL